MKLLAGLLVFGFLSPVLAEIVDYRYIPPNWRTPIGLPGDWHKPLINETGAWVTDFGPGPYATPFTRLAVGIEGTELVRESQSVTDARVPVVETVLTANEATVRLRAFSIVPESGWEEEPIAGHYPVRRMHFLNRCPGWADPPDPADEIFDTVAYATNRPIHYEIAVPEGSAHQVFLGFADPYRTPGARITRLMRLIVEGADEQTIDPVAMGQNVAQVFRFDGRDVDQDGQLEVTLRADNATVDPNLFINAIWAFPVNMEIDEAALIRGDLNDRATVLVDCGHEPQFQSLGLREDIIEAAFSGAAGRPYLDITTGRKLVIDQESQSISWRGNPFVTTKPLPDRVEKHADGWRVYLPQGTPRAVVRIFSGNAGDGVPPGPDVEQAIARLSQVWGEDLGLPWDRMRIPDPGLQGLLDGSIRIMYQLLERVDGKLQSQPGPSVYRGLWVSNQPRVGRALTHLGDLETPRTSFARTWEFQQDNGQVVVLTPPSLLKETGIAVEAVVHHAQLTGDMEFLEDYWPKLVKAADWVMAARKRVTDPEALNYGLMPSGLADGGVGGIVPEYTTNYWSLLLLRNVARAAYWLGHDKAAWKYGAEFADYMAAFRRAAARDMQVDAHGNAFLPIRMQFDPETDPAPGGQTVFSYIVYPARLFDKHDPLVEGNFGMLMDAPRAEGLVLSTGWLRGGVQPFIENTRASARIWLGQIDEVTEVLYSIANHAAPTHVYIEEQLPGTGPRKATGDVPHSSASAEFVNLIRYMLALEDGDQLHLMKAIPPEWIREGARLYMDDLPTEFGRLTYSLDISADGSEGTLRVEPVAGKGPEGGVLIHLEALRAAGFRAADGSPLPDQVGLEWGRGLELSLQRKSH